MSGIAQGGVSAVSDLVSRILNTKRPRTSPTGSSVARKRATKVRAGASQATDELVEQIRSGEAAARHTAKSGHCDSLTTYAEAALLSDANRSLLLCSAGSRSITESRFAG